MPNKRLMEEAQKAFDAKDLWYKVNADEYAFKDGYIEGTKRVAELKKENAQLLKRIKELEEEITNLKEEVNLYDNVWNEDKSCKFFSECIDKR